MWLWSLATILQSTYTFSSLSWGLLAASFLALLAGLYVWHLNVRLLRLWLLMMDLKNYPPPINSSSIESRLLSPSQELLTRMATLLGKGLDTKRMIALCSIWLMIAVAAIYTEARGQVRYEFKDARVEVTGPYQYWITANGQRFHTTVCQDYAEPPFTTGITLSQVIFVDKGDCWSLNPNEHAGYFFKRGQDGRPTTN